MKALVREDPSPVLLPQGRPSTGSRVGLRRHRLQAIARRLGWGLALLGLLGCAVLQPGGSKPAGEPTQPAGLAASTTFTLPPISTTPATTATTSIPAASPGQAPLPLPGPSPTPIVVATLAPSLTPFPSLTPQPTFDVSLYTPSSTSTNAPALLGHCCTLRVHNGGSIPLWIGKKLPRNGTVIKPRWYLEFYLAQPKTMTVYWCLWVDRTKVPDDDLLGAPARGSDNLFDCRHRDVQVKDGLTEIYVQ